MNKIVITLLLTTVLFSNCKMDMLLAESGAENAVDFALKGNHKYALIEVNEAITYTKQALTSCKGQVSSLKMEELSKNLSSLYQTKKKITERVK